MLSASWGKPECNVNCSCWYHDWMWLLYIVWFQIFNRENFCINRNFLNKIFVNSCHFHDTILIDYAAIDTGSSSVSDEERKLWMKAFMSMKVPWLPLTMNFYECAWTPTHHELLHYSCAEGNVHDPYAVKVMKSGVVVGHLPKKIRKCNLLPVFKKRGCNLMQSYEWEAIAFSWFGAGRAQKKCLLIFSSKKRVYWTSCRNHWLLTLKK